MNFVFSEIEILGEENLPREGPVILCSNHNSQYVDAGLLVGLKREINFIVAASSTKKKVLQFFLSALNFIPTARPIDHKRRGEGKVLKVDGEILVGKNTKFTKLKKGVTLTLKDKSFIIKEVMSDT